MVNLGLLQGFALVFLAIIPLHRSFLNKCQKISGGSLFDRSLTSAPLGSTNLFAALDGVDATLADQPHVLVVLPSQDCLSYFRRKPGHEAVPWSEVFAKISEKMIYEKLNKKYLPFEEDLTMRVVTLQEIVTQSTVSAAPVALFVSLAEADSDALAVLDALAKQAKVTAAYNCSAEIQKLQRYGEYDPFAPAWKQVWLDWRDKILRHERAKHKVGYEIALDMWQRHSLEDILFMVFVLLDSYTNYPIQSVQSATSSASSGLKQMQCMTKNCMKEMIDCFKDENCRKALNCLNKCKGNDQVCAYRCITSHESPIFERFAKCILQRNNCMCNQATLPVFPDPAPLASFRGQEVSFEVAENIFLGHLRLPEGQTNPLITDSVELLPWSWKVVCGQNPAYDYFACQHQLFYRNERNPQLLWYDPVFRVTTIYGEEVWRRRHYRVKRGKNPGQFYFTVSDNGVISHEHWRILDCAEDFSWAVFFYAGAASAAGTSYSGSLLVTPDGKWPRMEEATKKRIESAFDRAHISSWELFEVHNEDCCSDNPAKKPPLDIPFNKTSNHQV